MTSNQVKKTLLFYGLSCLLGLLVGLVAASFKELVVFLSQIQKATLTFNLSRTVEVLLSISISIIFTVTALFLVHRYSKEAKGSGIPEIEGRLLGLRPINWRSLLPVKLFGASLSLAANMILGREGPTIQMGGNLGAMLAEKFRLSHVRTDILIGAGAAAGLAAAFNAPLAGILFILEEMRNHFRLSITSFQSVMIACVVSTIVVNLIFGSEAEIHMHHFQSPPLWSYALFFILGLIVGMIGLFFNKGLTTVLNKTKHFSFKQRLIYTIITASIIGFIHYGAPALVGGGYQIIQESLNLNFNVELILLILFTRFMLTILCYSTGIPGGIFAPLLSIGTLVGVAFGAVVVPLAGDSSLFIGMFAVAGMGGLFAACIQAPITGIVLIVEMTGNYQLIFPLMITCITSTAVIQFASESSIYHQLLESVLEKK